MTSITYDFLSEASGGDAFTVVSFSAHEALSTLYEYRIQVKAPLSAALPLDDVLNAPARFTSRVDSHEYPVHGILSDFQEMQTAQGYVHYRATLVPRLWALSIYKTNEIYTEEKTVDNIILTVLENAGLQSETDFDLNGLDKSQLLERDYVCQFGESDFDFISRLMENEGIFYYFEQGDGPAEKIIFVNDLNYESIKHPGLVFDVAAQTHHQYNSIEAWSCRKQRLSAGVTVRDFNPDQPSLDISDSLPIDHTSQGTEYIYGENIRDSNEASYLTEIRAQESLCNKTRFYAESSVARLHSGYLFAMDMHPNDLYNGIEYLAIEVNHEGQQLDTDLSSGSVQDTKPQPQYRNNFVAIQADEQYRPPRKTRKPRFYGTMTAFIYSETGVNKAEIDEYGRYRVLLPFDRADGTRESTDPNRKASAWIRMAQNYVGEGKGSYYPLTGGTEVLLTFINGDPDQPIIVGAVPNASEPSLLTSENEFESTVQTGGGNKIRMGDVEGEDRIVLESPTANSWVRIGTPNDPPANFIDDDASDGIKMSTALNYELSAGHTSIHKSNGGNGFYTGTSTKIDKAIEDYQKEMYASEGKDDSGNIKQDKDDSGNPVHPTAEETTATDENSLPQNILYSEGHTRIEAEKNCQIQAQDNSIKFEMTDAGVTLDTGGKELKIDTGGAKFRIDCGTFSTNNAAECDYTAWAADTETFYGNKFEWMFGATESFFIGGKVEASLAESVEIFVGLKQEINVANSTELYIGFKQEFTFAPLNLELSFAPTIKYEYAPDLEFGGPIGIRKKPEVDIEAAVNEIKTLQSDISSTNLILRNVASEIGSSKIVLLADSLRIYS